MQESTFVELETLFLALGDKTRLKLLAMMADAPVAVGLLADRLNESQPKVSRHLAYLRNAGVVSTQRDGKWIYYGINYPVDPARRRILETVVRSIAVMRIAGEDVYFTDATATVEKENDTYVETYMPDTDYYISPDEGEDLVEYRTDDEELDVFLL